MFEKQLSIVPKMLKKGDIWISAVLYIGIGIVAITMILGAALPMIENLKDKNTIEDTKNLIYVLDKNIRAVASEGPGSQRELNPFIVNKGNFYIDFNDTDSINWSITTKAFYIENDATIQEGSIDISSMATNIKGENIVTLGTHYDKLNLSLQGDLQNPFLGTYTLVVKNTGSYTDDKLVIEVHVQ